MNNRIPPPNIRPITAPTSARTKAPQGPSPGGTSFQQVLQSELQTTSNIKFSAHATARLQESRRQLTPQDLSRIATAVDKVEAKGGRESLLLLDNLALVVSVPNRTVITAVGGERMRENVFTNIDSAAIV